MPRPPRWLFWLYLLTPVCVLATCLWVALTRR